MLSKRQINQQEDIRRLRRENELLRQALDESACGRELIRQRDAFSKLLDVGNAIVAELDPNRVLALVATKAREIIQAETVVVPIIDENRDQYTYMAAAGKDAAEILGGSLDIQIGMCGWVLKNERPLLFGETNNWWMEEKALWEEGQQSALLVPLFGRNQIIGGLSGLGKTGNGSFTEHDLEILTMFANQVSIAIENARLFQNWQHTVHTLEQEVIERRKDNDALQILVESTVGHTGIEFFDNMVKKLCTLLDCECALIAELLSQSTLKITSMEIDSNRTSGQLFPLAGTPCQEVVRHGFCHYPENLPVLFPDAVDIIKMDGRGYTGIPILNDSGMTIGVMCAISRKRLDLPPNAESILKILAARTAAEFQRLQVEEAVTKSETLLTETQNVAGIGSWEWDPTTNSVAWSEGFYRILDLEPGIVAPSLSQWFERIHSEDLGKAQGFIDAAIRGDDVVTAEYRLIVAGDSIRHVFVKGRSQFDKHNNLSRMSGILQDITDKVRAEEEWFKASKLESVGVLAGGIAHDFNNILMAILGNLSMAVHFATPGDRVHQLLKEAEKASLRAKDLTQQLLTFSKGGEPVKVLASIAEIIHDSAKFVLRGSNVRCDFAIPDDLWLVESDKGQMSQVIQNLIINANHAMPEGGIIRITGANIDTIDLPGIPLPATANYVKITIRDQGIGIPGNIIDKIFDPYFSTKQEGSGLGLTITHAIISKHKGHIAVESTQGVGTTFTIHLPASPRQMEEKKEIAIAPKQGNVTVLVMDDEEMVRDVASTMLTHLGYKVVTAKDGAEAIELYTTRRQKHEPVDIIIMDITIPGGMGGKDAVKEVLGIDPDARVMVSSGYSNDPIMANFQDYGFVASVTKPYRLKDLTLAINRVLS